MVKGLPPLKLDVGRGGYLDGYIVHAISLQKMFVTRNFEDLYAMALEIGYEKEENKPLTNYKRENLAILRLIHSWARVQIIERISVSKIHVYFIDTGVEQDVDINNLYEMPSKLKKTPPLAIPIYMDDSGGEEIEMIELVKLRGAKMALKLKGAVGNERFVGTEFTVFESDTNSYELIGKALKNPNFHFKSFKYLPLTSTTIISTTYAEDEQKGNVAVVIISIICVFIFLMVIGVAVACCVRKYRQKRREQLNDFNVPSPSQLASDNAVCNESTRTPERTLTPILTIPSEDLAVVTACIAVANHEKDKEREKIGEFTPATEEHEAQGVPGKTICIPARSLAAGGEQISQLSTIYPDLTPHPQCSTPTVNFTSLRTNAQVVLHSSKEQELYNEDLSNYSDILDIRQFISKTNPLNQPIFNVDEMTYMTAPSSMAE